MPEILIIGGGAAGMMAAITAKNKGGKVSILERNDRLGRKILATGNGRCNYTNVNISIENYHGDNPKFAYSSLSRFNSENTVEFFERLGIVPAIEDRGKIYPLSFQSSSILDVLRFELDNLGIEVLTSAMVVDIKKGNKFELSLENGRKIYGDKVILSTGGSAAPNTGSDGNGYGLAKKLGHRIVDVFPGIVQLKLAGHLFKQMAGVRFLGSARLFSGHEMIREDMGDILFTNYGISGPPILQLSRTALKLLKDGKDADLEVVVINKMSEDELYNYLLYRFGFMGRKTMEVGLIGMVNKKLILPILGEANIDKNKKIAYVSKAEVRRLMEVLKGWRFKIIASKSFQYAQTTAGGVDTAQVNNLTMESKLVKGLYFAGELLDIDGDSGGFNLQWAWSSGYIAGLNASSS